MTRVPEYQWLYSCFSLSLITSHDGLSLNAQRQGFPRNLISNFSFHRHQWLKTLGIDFSQPDSVVFCCGFNWQPSKLYLNENARTHHIVHKQNTNACIQKQMERAFVRCVTQWNPTPSSLSTSCLVWLCFVFNNNEIDLYSHLMCGMTCWTFAHRPFDAVLAFETYILLDFFFVCRCVKQCNRSFDVSD